MSSLVEQFKQAFTSKEALIAFQASFQQGKINPIDWKLDEILELHNELLQLFRIDTKNFIQESINFFLYLAALLNNVIIENMESHKKYLLQKIIQQCTCYIKLAQEKLNKSFMTPKLPIAKTTVHQNINKRALTNAKLPIAKKRKVELPAPKIDESQLQFLKNLGYEQKSIEAILSSPKANKNYSLLTKWHERFIHKLSHQQLVTLTLLADEQVFLALNTYWSTLEKWSFTGNEMLTMVHGKDALRRMKHFCEHIDILVQKGFSKQQLISISKSVNLLHNVPIRNEKLYQLSLDELTCLITQSHPDYFLIINQYFDYLSHLSLTGKHLISLINDLPRVYWVLNNFNYFNLCTDITPEDLCFNDILLLELHYLKPIKIKLLKEAGYSDIENHNQLDFLLCYTDTLKSYGFTLAHMLTLAQRTDLIKNVKEYIVLLSKLRNLDYSSEQMVLLGMNPELSIIELDKIATATPFLLECGYQHSHIINIFTVNNKSKNIFSTVTDKSSALISQGYHVADLSEFFCKLRWEKAVDTVLTYSPQLLVHGLTHKQILKIALNNGAHVVELINTNWQEILDAIKRTKCPHGSKEELILNLFKILTNKRHTMVTINNLLKDTADIKTCSKPLFMNLINHTTYYYYPSLKSYIFIYPHVIVKMRETVYTINSVLKTLDQTSLIQALKGHSALIMNENLWPQIWPTIAPPTLEITNNDLHDFSLDKKNYFHSKRQDTCAFILCDSKVAALMSANRLNYLNMIIQKSNEGIEEPIPVFNAVAIQNYVRIDNYGAYYDSLSYYSPERSLELSNNVDDLSLLSATEELRLGLVIPAQNVKDNPLRDLITNEMQINNRGHYSTGTLGFFNSNPNEKRDARNSLIDEDEYVIQLLNLK